MENFISGVIVGVIVLQTAIFAPTIFKTLELEEAGVLLRSLFPKFFVLLALLGASALVSSALKPDTTMVQWVLGGLSLVCPLICRWMIPATNKARDEGDDATFKRLHTASVVLTLVVLLGNLVTPVWTATVS